MPESSIISRRWLLGSTVLAATNAIAAKMGLVEFSGTGSVSDDQSAISSTTLTGTDEKGNTSASTAEFWMGLSGIDYYGPDQPFLDRVKMARLFVTSHGNAIETSPDVVLDANGKPRRLLNGATRLIFQLPGCFWQLPKSPRRFIIRHNAGYVNSGIYNTVVKRGKGYAILEQNAGNVGNIDFTYFALDNLPTGQDFDLQVTMVREEHDALLLSGELFNPDFTNYVGRYGGFRFMDWSGTNSNISKTMAEYGGLSKFNWNIAPFEVMIALCNRFERGGWFCVPAQFTDQAVTELAHLISNTMKPWLPVKIERANEDWNFMFRTAAYDNEQAKATGLGWTSLHWSKYRATQVAKIFDAVFRQKGQRKRLNNVFAVLTVYPQMEPRLAGALYAGSEKLPGTGIRKLNEVFDSIAVATYYSGGMAGTNPADTAIVRQWMTEGDAGRRKALDQMYNGGKLTSQPDTAVEMFNLVEKTWLPIADEHSLRLVSYETGFGATVDINAWPKGEQQAVVDWVNTVQMMPEMRQQYRDKYTREAQIGIDTSTLFVSSSGVQAGQGGFFGTKPFSAAPETPRSLGFADARGAGVMQRASAPLSLTSNAPTQVTQGTSVPIKLAVKGGQPPYFLTLIDGGLPSGRSFAGFDEAGTFAALGTNSRTYRVLDSSPIPKTATLTIVTETVTLAAQSFRYMRLEVDSVGGKDWEYPNARTSTSLSDLQFLNQQGQVIPHSNIEAGSQATSSYFSNTPARAFDGNSLSVWESGRPHVGEHLFHDQGENDGRRPAAVRFVPYPGRYDATPSKGRLYFTNDEREWRTPGAGIMVLDFTKYVPIPANAPGNLQQNNPRGYTAEGLTFPLTYPG